MSQDTVKVHVGAVPPMALRRQVQLLRNESVTALLDAVNLHVAYVAPRWRPLLSAIQQRDASVQETIAEGHDASAFVEFLAREGFLTPADTDEDRLAPFRQSLRPKPIRVLDIIPTFACNLACTYCYQRDEVTPDGRWHNIFLDVAEGEAMLDTFLAHQAPAGEPDRKPSEICFIGGEPLLHMDLLHALVPQARRHELGRRGLLNLTVVTNATFVTRAIAKFLADYDVFVIVSVDGRQEVNDKVRITRGGEGSFAKMRQGYALLREAGCRLGISQTVGNHNNETYVEETRYILDTFRPDDLCTNSCLHGLPGQPNQHRVGATEFGTQLSALYGVLARVEPGKLLPLLNCGDSCGTSSTERGCGRQTLRTGSNQLPEQIVRRFRSFLARTRVLHYCGAQTEKVVVAPSGKAHFCEGFAFLNTGMRSWEERLAEPEHTARDRLVWAEFSPVNVPECFDCSLVLQCGGGCRYDAFTLDGSLGARDSYRCNQDRGLFRWFVLDFVPSVCDVAPKPGQDAVLLSDERRQEVLRTLSHSESHVAWR